MPVMTKTPSGDDIVILSRAEFDRLIDRDEDAADAKLARAAIKSIEEGELALTSDEVKQLLAADSSLAWWRKKRGLSQAALAKTAGIGQSFLSALESGNRTGDVKTWRAIADALDVGIDDIAP